MTYVAAFILGLATGVLFALARNEPDRRKARRLYTGAAASALAVLIVAFAPVLPYLID